MRFMTNVCPIGFLRSVFNLNEPLKIKCFSGSLNYNQIEKQGINTSIMTVSNMSLDSMNLLRFEHAFPFCFSPLPLVACHCSSISRWQKKSRVKIACQYQKRHQRSLLVHPVFAAVFVISFLYSYLH